VLVVKLLEPLGEPREGGGGVGLGLGPGMVIIHLCM